MKSNIILNIDWFTAVAPFLDEVMKSGNVTEDALYPFVDQYIDLASGEKSQIGAIAFNVFSQIAYVKSHCITDYTIIENGKSNCDEEIVKWCRAFCDINGKYNIEPWGVWIKRCRERGLEAWVSVRMNDTHDECPEEVRIMREKYALGDHEKYGRCMNYAYRN